MRIITSKELLKDDNDFFNTSELENFKSVEDIVNDVKQRGENAVIEYSKKFADGDFKSSNDFCVSDKEIEHAFNTVEQKTIDALEKCINNIRYFSQKQFECIKNLDLTIKNSQLGHKIIPLESVLCYVPGGNYPLPSSAIMTVIPAKVAQVKNVIVTSPKIKPQTIVAAKLSGADCIYKLGGVQAISLFAYGSDTIKPVDKIVGPGNKYVTLAKKIVYGKCSIDFLAGPSEVLIVADDNQNPELVSADILAQCEHDKDARGYLICFSENFAKNVNLNELSKMSYRSKYYFIRQFHARTGFTPKEYLANLRFDKSKELLLKTNISVKEIAEHVGFSYRRKLIKLNQKKLGLTPSQFRKLSVCSDST